MLRRLLAVCILVVIVGCSNSENATSPAVPKPSGTRTTSPTTTAPASDPAAFSKTFLAAVNDGKATASQLSPTFKPFIAEPVFASDKTVGYSDSAADLWLKSFQGKLDKPTLSAPGGTGDMIVFVGDKPTTLTLRLVKAGNDWSVDWFHVTDLVTAHVTLPTGDAAYQAWAATAFLEALLSRKDLLASAMMHPAAKARLAPPFGSGGEKFNRGGLEAKLATSRGGFNGFTIGKADGGIVTGEVSKGDVKKPFSIKLAKGERTHEWLVDEIKID